MIVAAVQCTFAGKAARLSRWRDEGEGFPLMSVVAQPYWWQDAKTQGREFLHEDAKKQFTERYTQFALKVAKVATALKGEKRLET
ncbi:unnamed protein product [Symbiodinium natans]|uniref:Uncharacterized protein n=1 Tax=Symbiodinium natans TaxID=878477 RepID=A0A812R502_9DINO|nr:unnamed protein product [Symbiodinium natans]